MRAVRGCLRELETMKSLHLLCLDTFTSRVQLFSLEFILWKDKFLRVRFFIITALVVESQTDRSPAVEGFTSSF
jgi:hypothetical protein